MKKTSLLLAATLLIAAQVPASAQFGKSPNSAADNALTKVFGTNLNFSATMEIQGKMGPNGEEMATSAKIFFARGNSRMEMDMTKMTGSKLPPEAIARMQAMGMDKMTSISRHDTKTIYMICPGLEAYAKMPSPEAQPGTNDDKIVTTELGKETVDGHPCVKNKYTVTSPKPGESLVMLAWNATDLKNYPVKIEITPEAKGGNVSVTTLHFVDINTAPPAANLFEPPTGYRAYTDAQTMMQTEMMKKMGGSGMGMPPGQQ